MRSPRISFCLLLLLVACASQPAVPTPVAEQPTVPATAVPATPTGDVPTVVPTTALSEATTESVTEVPEPAQTTPPDATEAPAVTSAPIAIGSVDPITFTLPANLKISDATVFASYPVIKTNIQPQSSAPAIAADLGNVAVPFILSPEQRQMLGQQGFTIAPGETREFFELYERARYNYEPVFVTSDSLLHVYHLLFDRTLRVAEQEHFIPMLAAMDWALLDTSLKQLDAVQGTPWQDAARRNAAYFAVAVKLLNPEWQVPEGLRDLADPDLKSIDEHAGISASAIFPAYPYGEDWSQYVPRGHYTRSEALMRYFRAMMWHGRITLRQDDEIETQQSALMTLAWQQTTVEDKPAEGVWHAIYDPTVFFVGRSDDLTPTEYSAALQAAYGEIGDPRALVDATRFARFQELIGELRPPEILGMVIDDTAPVDDTPRACASWASASCPTRLSSAN